MRIFEHVDNEQIDKAARTLKEIHEKRSDAEKQKNEEEKKEVLNKYGKKFNVNEIEGLEFDALKEFSDFKNNHHWKNIFRHHNEIKENYEKNKRALKILVDPSGGTVYERLYESYKISKGIGPALLTAILMVEFPETCGVLNRVSYEFLEAFNLIAFPNNTVSYIRNYSKANEIILKLKELTQIDLWMLDWAFFYYVKNMKKDIEELDPSEFSYWVEKTREKDHVTDKIEDSRIGSLLWSPKKTENGRDIYNNMEKIKEDDVIIHLLMDKGNSFIGVSKVEKAYETFPIPDGLKWNGEGYRVKLKEYREFSFPLEWNSIVKNNREALLNVSNKSEGLFYNKNMTLHMGAYITKAPIELVNIINAEYRSATGEDLPYFDDYSLNRVISEIEEPIELLPGLPRNIILHGPVGTGKTFYAGLIASGIINSKIKGIKDIEDLLDTKKNASIPDSGFQSDSKRIKSITFHQSYGYENFIGGITAIPDNNELKYGVKEGIFFSLCGDASKDPKNPFVIIIDEINRGDISRIFGELITLIEEDKRYRDNNKGLKLSIPNFNKEFFVPDNVFIIGTMNDSDRSIALLDMAIRRRFTFFGVSPDAKILETWITGDDEFKSLLMNAFNNINSRISEKIGLDFQIGHAFFKSLSGSKNPKLDALYAFKYKVIPLLEEMFYGQEDKLVKNILNNTFFEKIGNGSSLYRLKENCLDADKIDFFVDEIGMLCG